ncbi:SDR family oxidoreductase [Streptomyces sp. NPDC057381]|uniref:SDR family oxidoreductase n=1 Tax=unclassified Streptomyces TaxID=2593676 RepID=UPI0036335151
MHGRPNQASYAAAKEAIRGLSRVAANEWARHDIRANVVRPTALTAGVAAWAEARPEPYARAVRPVRRLGVAGRGTPAVLLGGDHTRLLCTLHARSRKRRRTAMESTSEGTGWLRKC